MHYGFFAKLGKSDRFLLSIRTAGFEVARPNTPPQLRTSQLVPAWGSPEIPGMSD